MKEKRKSIDFINSICASRSQSLLGEQRLIRMAEAESLASAFDVLRESAFGGEINFSSAEYERVIESEEKALNAFVEAVTEALAKGDKIALVGFGTFETKKRAARKGKNPQTGAVIDIAASTVPAFKAGRGLKDAVNK